MHTLPLLEPARPTLEKCVFCPKLCRSACPVSNAEPKETITPWGKMSMAYFLAHGDVPATSSFARPAWACTGCLACRESCDHENDVPTVLFTARSGMMNLGIAPPSTSRVVTRFERHATKTRQAVRELASRATVRPDAETALLVGCTYARGAPREAADAIAAATGLTREPVALVEACCGLPLLHAGDAEGFARQARVFAAETSGKKTLLVADAGCALTLRKHYRGVATLSPPVELIVERAAKDLTRLNRVSREDESPVRYHDPCLLGRGLGIYEEPRAVLSRALGRAPNEFDTHRDKAQCSGAGGLLPVTMPEASSRIADTRLEEHARNGGGRVVTACAGSLLAFRRRSRVKVDDLVTWIARAVSPWRP
jgi:Fe-S oxidoreductase